MIQITDGGESPHLLRADGSSSSQEMYNSKAAIKRSKCATIQQNDKKIAQKQLLSKLILSTNIEGIPKWHQAEAGTVGLATQHIPQTVLVTDSSNR